MLEGNSLRSAQIMAESCKAQFPPAFAALAQIFNQGYGVKKDPKYAETLFLRATSLGHVPALFMLCKLYAIGDLGPMKQLFGRIALPLAWLRLWILTRFMIFSVRTFRHFNITTPPMFNEKALKS
jgi:TPR repeat protein